MQAAGDPLVVEERRQGVPVDTAPPKPPASRIVRAIVPLALGGAIALVPVPDGLAPDAWYYFALFVTVIAAIITEPMPAAALGMAGVSAAAVLGLVRDTPAASAQWALS